MKKQGKRLFLAALTVIIACLVTISCPSEPDPIVPISDWNIELKGGNLYYKFDGPNDPKVVDGKTYIVTLRIDDCDPDFPGSHMGAKLCYYPEDFDEEGAPGKNFADTDSRVKILSGWTDSDPDTVIEGPFTYTWEFKAGEAYKDDKPIENPATFPDDGSAVQFFFMQAQDENYKPYTAKYIFHIKGSVTLSEEESFTGTLTNKGTIVVDTNVDGGDPAHGIGNILDANFNKVKNATPGAVLRVYIENCNVTKDDVIKDQWAIGSIGNFENIGSTNPNAKINVPKTLGSNTSFTCDIRVSKVLQFVNSSDSHIFVNIWEAPETGFPKIAKIELWEYEQ